MEHVLNDPSWNYYQRWLIALEQLALATGLLTPKELEQQTSLLMAQASGKTQIATER
jgi:hypothetical protein